MSVGTVRSANSCRPIPTTMSSAEPNSPSSASARLRNRWNGWSVGEADARQHLLAMRRHGPRRATGRRLGESGGRRAGLVPRSGQRGLERLDRDERFGQAVPDGLEPGDRTAELHPLDGVCPRQRKHGPAGPGQLVGDGAPTGGDCRVPDPVLELGRVVRSVLDADDVQAGVRVDPANRGDLHCRDRDDDAPERRAVAADDYQVGRVGDACRAQPHGVCCARVEPAGMAPRRERREQGYEIGTGLQAESVQRSRRPERWRWRWRHRAP